MDKIIEYRYGDHNSEIVSLISSENLHKKASYSDELKEYITFLKKKVDKTYALVNALSAGEHYGCNRNGDFFPEDVLQRYHKTFEALGHVYKHHVNKDPRRSFGKVVFSHYNPSMHRVELIIELDNTRAADIIERLEKQIEDVKVSMACRVPYDVCSICGNKARKLSEYCSHLKEKMGRIMGDGRRVYAVNTMPKFFDISVVTIPADRTAGFIAKVASDSSTSTVDVNEYIPSAKVAEDLSKESDLESSADIKKKIDIEIKALTPDPHGLILKTQGNLTKDKLVKLAEYPLNEVLSTMIGLRIMPKKEDFMKLALYSFGHGDFAEDVANSDYSFEPEESINITDVSCDNFNVKIAELLKKDVPQLSLTKPYIIARAFEKVAETSEPCQKFSTVLEKYGYDNSDKARSEWPMQNEKKPSKLKEIFVGTEEPPLLGPKQNPLVPMAILGGLYTSYAKVFKKAFDKGGFAGLLGKYPWLAPLLIGAGTVGSLKLQDLYFNKTASAGKLIPAMIFAGLPASYLYAGMQEAKVRKGKPISKLQNFVRKHPFLSTLIATGATGAGVNLIKRASVISQMDEGSINSIYEDLIKES
jgi:hypothetical protein